MVLQVANAQVQNEQLDGNFDFGLTDLRQDNRRRSPAVGLASGLAFNTDNLSAEHLDRPDMRAQLAVKRLIDIGLSLAALVALGPLLVIVAVLVKSTGPGPVFFRQSRPGLHGKPFMMFKFRTMFVAMEDRSGSRQTVRNDPRVTPIGNFLRRTSIDELPQLLNILLGQMSIAGPRPHPMKMIAAGTDYERLVPYYHGRFAMKPGLSGWAQVNGYRGPTDTIDASVGRINHDLAYIQNFSLALDFKIIMGTLFKEFLGGSGF